jgi:3'(2'),5'-bisphosphate nucleotidase
MAPTGTQAARHESTPRHRTSASRPSALALTLARIADAAGRRLLAHYGGACEAAHKPDGSPVTAADTEAETVILAGLAEAFPGVPVLSEELAARTGAPAGPLGPRFFCVDPMDGTKEFLRRNGQFTVNIALIENGSPVAGAVLAPATGRLWLADRKAHVATVPTLEHGDAEVAWRPIQTRACPPEGLVAVRSSSHGDGETEAFLAAPGIARRMPLGSSLKFCRLAEGLADVYPRLGCTMEWDTAAGQAVLEAAGGHVLVPPGSPLTYGKWRDGFRNPGFIAWGNTPRMPSGAGGGTGDAQATDGERQHEGT